MRPVHVSEWQDCGQELFPKEPTRHRVKKNSMRTVLAVVAALLATGPATLPTLELASARDGIRRSLVAEAALRDPHRLS